jgi:ATP-dependent Lon protease
MVGSPGIGKTSLARSIARAMNRSFVHIGLAGVSSSMTIKGNERGYSGAIPGRILQQIKLAGYNNPVFLLDEIEKVSQSHHNGSPAAALLEVLDPDHNHRFTDEYLEVPFDLSQVMFLCGANYYDQIPAELRSRMEIIQLPNYTTEEKIAIAQKHLIKRVTKKTGLDTCNVTLEIDEKTIETIITHYTNEGGVRELEHALFRLGAHIARNIVDNNLHSQNQLANTYKITTNMLPTYLGKPLYVEDKSKYIL